MNSALGVKHLFTGQAEDQPQWPYWVQPFYYSQQEWHSMDHWVLETFGSTDWSDPECRWVGSNRRYWFRHESDRTLFMLRWA